MQSDVRKMHADILRHRQAAHVIRICQAQDPSNLHHKCAFAWVYSNFMKLPATAETSTARFYAALRPNARTN